MNAPEKVDFETGEIQSPMLPQYLIVSEGVSMSNTIGKISMAIAEAQSNMSNPVFDKENPMFKSKFASLAAVRDAVVPALAKSGVACLQFITGGQTNVLTCVTLLSHGSGEWIKTELTGSAQAPGKEGVVNIQNKMSLTTYLRRYTLQSIACVSGDVDDDGNDASEQDKNADAAKALKKKAEAPVPAAAVAAAIQKRKDAAEKGLNAYKAAVSAEDKAVTEAIPADIKTSCTARAKQVDADKAKQGEAE
jgi:hypothetical protein